jgi:hypothetical protein
VPWSTLCRADWARNDPVLTTRGWLLLHYDPVSPGDARGHAAASEHQRVSLMAWAREGDCASTSPRSLDELAKLRTHTAHYSPAMIAPLSINSGPFRGKRNIQGQHYTPYHARLAARCARPTAASEHQGDGPGEETPIAGRPAHDHWTNSPSSGRVQPTIRPVMTAPLSIIHRTQTAGLSALFYPEACLALPLREPQNQPDNDLRGQ